MDGRTDGKTLSLLFFVSVSLRYAWPSKRNETGSLHVSSAEMTMQTQQRSHLHKKYDTKNQETQSVFFFGTS